MKKTITILTGAVTVYCALLTNLCKAQGVDSYNSTTITTTSTSDNVPANVGINLPGVNVNINGTGVPAGNTTYTTTTSYGSSSNYYNTNNQSGTQQVINNVANTNSGCMAPMDNNTFRDLMTSIDGQSFEEAKLKVAKQAVSASCVSAEQVKRLMGLFSFEESKLGFAKYTYDYTYDKPNYFKINDAFGYTSSVNDLNNYLNSRK